jgi:hypothetical protein
VPLPVTVLWAIVLSSGFGSMSKDFADFFREFLGEADVRDRDAVGVVAGHRVVSDQVFVGRHHQDAGTGRHAADVVAGLEAGVRAVVFADHVVLDHVVPVHLRVEEGRSKERKPPTEMPSSWSPFDFGTTDLPFQPWPMIAMSSSVTSTAQLRPGRGGHSLLASV